MTAAFHEIGDHLAPRRVTCSSFTGLTEVGILLREQCAEQRDREFADSPQEEAVTSELASEAQIPC
jgi:hypothetical protein